MRGGLVAVPTDTIYGLAANGLDSEAVGRIYEIKGRPMVKPIILLLPDIDAAEAFCETVPESARLLAGAFWPGALSIVLRKSSVVPEIVTAGGDTVGLRSPDHPKALELLRLTGVPLAAPSANPTDLPSPKTVEDVLRYFDGQIECVIDGGPCSVGFESTIVDLTSDPYKIVRHGALTDEEVWKVLR